MAEYYFALTDINNAIDRLIHACPTTFYNGLQAARNIFSKDIAADVAPVRHGRWELDVLDGTPGYRPVCIVCSECHRINYGATPYCPNCGAHMGKQEDSVEYDPGKFFGRKNKGGKRDG